MTVSVSMTPAPSVSGSVTESVAISTTISPSTSESITASASTTTSITQTTSRPPSSTPVSASVIPSATETLTGVSVSSIATPNPSDLPSPSLSPMPSLVISTVSQSSIRLSVSLDRNPVPLLVTTQLTVNIDQSSWLRVLSQVRVYATSANGKLRGALLVVADVNQQFTLQLTIPDIPCEHEGEGAGLFVIGVDAATGRDSMIDYAWVPVADWTQPTNRVFNMTQSLDASPTVLVISATVKLFIVVQTNQSVWSGVEGVRLYASRTILDSLSLSVIAHDRVIVMGDLRLTDMQDEGLIETNSQIFSAAIDFSNLALSGTHANVSGNELVQYQWEAVAYNTAFESSVVATTAIGDATGMSNVVTVIVTATSVAVVTSAIASTVVMSASITAVPVAPVLSGVTISHSAWSPGVSPIIAIGNMQVVAMTGSMQISTLPTNYRAFANNLSWVNGNVKWFGGSADYSAAQQHPNVQDFSIKLLKEDVIAVDVERSATSDAPNDHPARQALYTTLVSFICVFAFFCVVAAMVCSRNKMTQSFSEAQKYQSRKLALKRAFVGLFTLAYFGLTASALSVLWVSSVSQNDGAIATLVLLLVGIPLPFLSVVLYREIATEVDKGPKDNEADVGIFAFISGARKGCEWYSVLAIYRRLTCAIAVGMLPRLPVTQCAVIAVVFVVCLAVNVRYKPFKGGWRSFDFMFELLGQISTFACCGISLYLSTANASDHLNSILGTILIITHVVAFIGMTVMSIASLVENCGRVLVSWHTRKVALDQPDAFSTYESPRAQRRRGGKQTCDESSSSASTPDSKRFQKRTNEKGELVSVSYDSASAKQVKNWLKHWEEEEYDMDEGSSISSGPSPELFRK
eukprot:c14004_g1_i1.p1 GENE.c14004_g1_i1~~c14004_g1_i1.p1  ORF type:complete len:860 (+),score=163.20 c14004_g1_i1:117-2696(+)